MFVLDLILVNVVFLLSFLMRYGLPLPEFNFRPYRESLVFLTGIYMTAFVASGMFSRRFRAYWHLFVHISCGVLVGTLFGIVFIYALRIRWIGFPSSVFLISMPTGLVVLFAANSILLRCLGRIRKKILLVGDSDSRGLFASSGVVEVKKLDRLEELLYHENIDEVIICEQMHEDAQLNLVVYLLLKLRVNVVFSPFLYANLLSGNVMEENSLRFIATSLGRKSDCEESFIRILDVAGSAFMLILLSPLMMILAALIKMTSEGPVIYRQVRVGKDGKEFLLYKLRTMVEGAENDTGPVLASENDPRFTAVGRFLRITRLDELPQLINVLKGEMSLVGPRPERPHFVKRHRILRELRLAVRPGLTGLAQIRSFYDLHPRHKTRYDYLYIQKRSFLLNLYILIKTIPVVFRRCGR
jgi:lipopolysaccharide/colanic/teichoic acid biosynthesis glycosyltransferase